MVFGELTEGQVVSDGDGMLDRQTALPAPWCATRSC